MSDGLYAATPNLATMFFDQAARYGAKPFLAWKEAEVWRRMSWTETADKVARLARALESLGIGRGERVALVSENRPEWLIADHAIMAAGAITVPGYATSTADDLAHVLKDSGAVAAISSGAVLAGRVAVAAEQAPSVRHLISIEPPNIGAGNAARHRLDTLLQSHAGPTAEIAERARSIQQSALACFIYTSGTGGVPKGVMLSHRALLANCYGAHKVLEPLGLEDNVFLSFLPLSHSYEHTAGQFFPIAIGAEIHYAEGADKLAQNMREARPTIMTAVPRLYEAMHQRITGGLRNANPVKRRLFEATLALGRKRYRDGKLGPVESLADRLLDGIVRSKVAAGFGGRLKAMVSGGAPLNPEIGIFFTALGVRLLQGYGQTEAAPVVSCNPPPPRRAKLHTVGPPLPGVEVKLAEDGEILVRGNLLMDGYWNAPEATAAVLKDGWLHTGDVGLIDADGYIQITDRKKDFIKNSGGELIAPGRIETILTVEPEIGQAMVFGDRKSYLVAVLVPGRELAQAQAGKPEAIGRALAAALERANAKLPQPERVRRFLVADGPFTIENGQLTPTLKIRRHIIRQIYADRVESLYA
jgi:long-chain acyl-CoA synthetase